MAFYYLWYNNDPWTHWNHAELPHWRAEVAARHNPGRRFEPERGELHARFFPALGPYSSADPDTVAKHLDLCSEAGIDTLVMSYLPAGRGGDTQGVETADVIGVV